jgi:hypothetical protein
MQLCLQSLDDGALQRILQRGRCSRTRVDKCTEKKKPKKKSVANLALRALCRGLGALQLAAGLLIARTRLFLESPRIARKSQNA